MFIGRLDVFIRCWSAMGSSMLGRGRMRHFVGVRSRNWRHRPNRDCAKWLIQEVWPLVRQRLPDLELSVYGANQTPEDAALTQESLGAYAAGSELWPLSLALRLSFGLWDS